MTDVENFVENFANEIQSQSQLSDNKIHDNLNSMIDGLDDSSTLDLIFTLKQLDRLQNIGKCTTCKRSMSQSLYCDCGETNIFQSIKTVPFETDAYFIQYTLSRDRYGLARELLSMLNRYPKSSIINTFDTKGNVIEKQTQYSKSRKDIKCLYGDYGMSCSAPTITYLQGMLNNVIKYQKPHCMFMIWKNINDKTGHALNVAVYPNGAVFMMDPNGRSKLTKTKNNISKFSDIENRFNTYFNKVYSKDGKTQLHIIPQNEWCSRTNLNVPINKADTSVSGLCVVMSLITASLVIEHNWDPPQIQQKLHKFMCNDYINTQFIIDCISKILYLC
jgi:hypothetical protein